MEKIILKDYQGNPIHVYIYKPEGEIKGVVQIVHGASEHFARYGLFAEHLNKHGYLAIGSDILGHGLSTETLDYVHFADKDGDILAYESVLLVKEYIEENFKQNDVFILGHSMGSFIARKLVLDFPDFYKKAVFSGTAFTSAGKKMAGNVLIALIKLFKGPKYVSRLIQAMAIDSIPHKMLKDGIISGALKEEWLTRDPEIQQYYQNSNMCGQPFTIQANHDMVKWISFVDNKKNIALGKKEQPIFFITGEKDALSNYGADIKKLFKVMSELGYTNLHMKLYEDCRHETLNELNKGEVYNDILKFIEE